MQIETTTTEHYGTLGSRGTNTVASPPAAVSLKPFLRDCSADKQRQNQLPNPDNNAMKVIIHQSSYEEQDQVVTSQFSQPSQAFVDSELGLMVSRSGSKVRPGTSLFYEPSLTKNNESTMRVSTRIVSQQQNHHKEPEIGRFRVKEQSFTNQFDHRSASAPATSIKKPNATNVQHNHRISTGGGAGYAEPSFGTLELSRTRAGQEPSDTSGLNNDLRNRLSEHQTGVAPADVDQSLRIRRSVQVPHPESRVLFELTTISNELNRENMTTLQTSLIPNSNRYRGLRGSSEKPLMCTTTEEQDRPQIPNLASSAESLLQQHQQVNQPQPADYPDPNQVQIAEQNQAYHEVIMKRAKRQLAMPSLDQHQEPQLQPKRNATLRSHHRHSSISAAFLPGAASRELQENKTAAASNLLLSCNNNYSQVEIPRIFPNKISSSPPATAKNANARGRRAAPRQRVTSHSELNFDNVTPNQYEDTDHAYTYSMYTETVVGRSDNQSRDPMSQRQGAGQTNKEYQSSAGTALQKIQLSQVASEGSKQASNQFNATRQGPESPDNTTQGAAFFNSVKERYILTSGQSSQCGDDRRPTERMSTKQDIGRIKEDCHNFETEYAGHTASNRQQQPPSRQKIHSDSIMSAQFQAESVHQMFSQDHLQVVDQQALFQQDQQHAEHKMPLSQREKNVESRSKKQIVDVTPIEGIVSLGSLDRKTFTLGQEKTGLTALNSKTDILSMHINQLTTPTEQMNKTHLSLLNTQKHPTNSKRASSLPRQTTDETECGYIPLAPSSYDISSDIHELLRLQQQNTQGKSQRDDDQNASFLQKQGGFVPVTHQGLINMKLSQPYHLTDHLHSSNTLERGGHGQSQLWQQQPNAIQSHRPQLIAKNINQLSNMMNAAGISDPSASNTHQSQTNVALQHQQQYQQQQQQQQQQQYIGGGHAGSQRQTVQQQVNTNLLSMMHTHSGAIEESIRARPLPHPPYMHLTSSHSPRKGKHYHNLPPQLHHNQQNVPVHKHQQHMMPNGNAFHSTAPVINSNRTQRPPLELSLDHQTVEAITETTPISSRTHNTAADIKNITNTTHREIQNNTTLLAPPMKTLQHTNSCLTTGSVNNAGPTAIQASASVWKQEIMMLRRQLNDARNSNLFLKKQTLQLQHTINMQAIQISQLEQVVGAKNTSQEEEQAKISILEVQYEEQKRLSDEILKKQEETEELYQQRVHNFVEEIEHLRSEKNQNAYGIQTNVMQLQQALQHLADLENNKQSYLAPFFNHFESLCQTIHSQVQALAFNPNNSLEEPSRESLQEQRHQVKMMKRQHNFEKFRKEIRNLCKNHYRAKIHDRDIELQKSLKHLKSQERQIQALQAECQTLSATHVQVNAKFNSLSSQNRQIIATFEQERLRLEKMHLEEVKRLHKAVKVMHKKAKAMEKVASTYKKEAKHGQNTQSRTTVDLATVALSESEGITTIENQQTSLSVIPLSTYQSGDHLPPETAPTIVAVGKEDMADTIDRSRNIAAEQQLLVIQNEQYKQTLEGQHVLIQELQKALAHNKELHECQLQQIYNQLYCHTESEGSFPQDKSLDQYQSND